MEEKRFSLLGGGGERGVTHGLVPGIGWMFSGVHLFMVVDHGSGG